MHELLDDLKRRTIVLVADYTYHARTPTFEAWCGTPGEYEQVTLHVAEGTWRYQACAWCFQSDDAPSPTQEVFNFE